MQRLFGSKPPENEKIVRSLTNYFNNKQPRNKNIQPFLVGNFENFNRAIYNYMVLLRQKEIHDRISKEINAANSRVNLNTLKMRINAQSSLSNNLRFSLNSQLKKRQQIIGRKLLNTNLGSVTNLNTYRKNLTNLWLSLPQESRGELSTRYNQRIGNIDKLLRRRNILAKNNSKITRENIDFLKSSGATNTQANAVVKRLEAVQNKNARAAVAVVKLWGHAGIGPRSNTNNGKRNALLAAKANQTLNIKNLNRANLNAILNNPKFAPPSNNSGNNRVRHIARVKSLLNSL